MTNILVNIEVAENGLPRSTSAHLLATAAGLGTPVAVVAAAPGNSEALASRLAAVGAAQVFIVETAEAPSHVAACSVAALVAAMGEYTPGAVLASNSAVGREIIGRLAVRTNNPVILEALELEQREGQLVASHSVFGGDYITESTAGAGTPLVTVGSRGAQPLAAVAEIVFGKAGAILIVAATSISMLGALGGEILSIPRILFAGARDGLLPKPLAKIHPQFFTPHIAVAFYALLGLIFAISGGFQQLATIASAAVLIIYLGVVLATIKLRKTNSASSEKTFLIPGGLIVPILAAAGIVWLLSGLTSAEFAGIGIFILIFAFIYLLIRQFRKIKKNATPTS